MFIYIKYKLGKLSKVFINELDEFGINLTTSHFNFNENQEQKNDYKKYTFIVVDDELFRRSAIKWVISSTLKSLNKNINVSIIEACDGMECILALYLAKNKKQKIDAIISDETMPFISGSFSSKIISDLISRESLINVTMFISTALSHTNISGSYSNIVKKIYSKPMDKQMIQEILDSIIL